MSPVVTNSTLLVLPNVCLLSHSPLGGVRLNLVSICSGGQSFREKKRCFLKIETHRFIAFFFFQIKGKSSLSYKTVCFYCLCATVLICLLNCFGFIELLKPYKSFYSQNLMARPSTHHCHSSPPPQFPSSDAEASHSSTPFVPDCFLMFS